MAEAANTPLRDPDAKNKGDGVECAVCLQPCIHPAQLPCGHIFCFLCVKGFANQSKRCAMCRQEIPRDFIDQPHLLEIDATPDSPGFDGGYQWFYEGRNGWWQYDERTSQELEGSYKNGDKTSELLIAGFLYIIDLENMIQLRRNDPSRRRKIKRDNSAIPKKGIAGLRGVEEPMPTTRGPLEPRARPIEGQPEAVTPATPTTTPQSASISGRESPSAIQDVMQATVDRIHALSLEEQNHTINDLRNEYRERFVSMVHTNPRHNGAQ